MTEEQKSEFMSLCMKYRSVRAGEGDKPYLKILDYVETLIDEAVKDAVNAQNSDKTE